MSIKIKTAVTGISMFRLLYQLKHLNLNWETSIDIETLLKYIFDKPDLFLTYNGKIDVEDCEDLGYNTVTWSKFKQLIESDGE